MAPLCMCVCIFAFIVMPFISPVRSADSPSFSEAINKGLITSSLIPEASGPAPSHKHPGILYTHNDHGGHNRIFAIDANTAALRATLTISGATNHNWEDMAVGSCGSEFCMYIGDIGDGDLPQKRYIGWHEKDCETLMIAPHGEIYIASKMDDKASSFAHVPTAGNWGTGHAVHVTPTVKFPFFTSKKNPVGGDISPDGTEMLIKFKEWVLYYKLGHGETFEHAITREPVKLPYHMEPRGESVCWSANADGYYTTSEGEGNHQPLYYYRRQ